MKLAICCALALALPATAQNVRPSTVLSDPSAATGQSSIDSEGDLVALAWVEGDDVVVSTSDGRGLTWTTPVEIDGDVVTLHTVRAESLQIVGSSIYVVWEAQLGDVRRLLFNASHDAGETWIGARQVIAGTVAERPSVIGWSYSAVPSGDIYFSIFQWLLDPFGEEVVVVKSPSGSGSFDTLVLPFLDAEEYHAYAPLRAEDDTVHLAWTERLAYNDQPTYYQRSDDGGMTWMPTPIEITPAQNTDKVYALEVENDRVVLAMVEPTYCPQTSSARLEIVVSDDRGETWGPNVTIGLPCSPGFPQPDIALSDGRIVVAWDDIDNAWLSPKYNVVAASHDGGLTWTTTILTNQSGAIARPTVELDGDFGAVAFEYDEGYTDRVTAASYSFDGGLTWTAPMTVSDHTSDATDPVMTLNRRYRNVIQTWTDDTAVPTTRVGGFRPQGMTPLGIVPGGSDVSYQFNGFGPAGESPFAILAVSLSTASGSYVLPDGRDTGLTFDQFSIFGLKKWLLFFSAIDAQGVGETKSVFATVDPGVTYYGAAIGLDANLEATHISDVVQVSF